MSRSFANSATAAAGLLAPTIPLFGGPCAGGFNAVSALLKPSLFVRDLGPGESDLDQAAKSAAETPYWNRAPLALGAIRVLVGWVWRRPT